MKEVLELLNKTKGVLGSLIVGPDGMIVISDLPTEFDDDFVGALVATVVDTAIKAISGLKNDNLKYITIEGDNYIVMITATKIGYLTVISKVSTNLGLIRVELKRAKAKINEK